MKNTNYGKSLELMVCAGAVVIGTAVGGGSMLASASNANAAAIAAAQDMGIPVGSVAPGAALQKLDGTKVNLSDYIGKQPVLIEFWATWCPNCKQLEPQLKAVKEKYGSKMRFVGVSVTVNQSIPRVKAYMEQYKVPLEMLWDAEGNAVTAYEVPATSFIVIVNKEGKIVYGGLGGDQKLDEVIRKVLPP